eukprot:gene10705-7437_t
MRFFFLFFLFFLVLSVSALPHCPHLPAFMSRSVPLLRCETVCTDTAPLDGGAEAWHVLYDVSFAQHLWTSIDIPLYDKRHRTFNCFACNSAGSPFSFLFFSSPSLPPLTRGLVRSPPSTVSYSPRPEMFQACRRPRRHAQSKFGPYAKEEERRHRQDADVENKSSRDPDRSGASISATSAALGRQSTSQQMIEWSARLPSLSHRATPPQPSTAKPPSGFFEIPVNSMRRRNQAALESVTRPFDIKPEPKPLPPTLLHVREPPPPLKPVLHLETLANIAAGRPQASRKAVGLLPPLSPQQSVDVSGIVTAIKRMEHEKQRSVRRERQRLQQLEEELEFALRDDESVRRLSWMVPRLASPRSRCDTSFPASPVSIMTTSPRRLPTSQRAISPTSFRIASPLQSARQSRAEIHGGIVAKSRDVSGSVAAGSRAGSIQSPNAAAPPHPPEEYDESEFLHYWELFDCYDETDLTDTLRKQRRRIPPMAPCLPGRVLSTNLKDPVTGISLTSNPSSTPRRSRHTCCGPSSPEDDVDEVEEERLIEEQAHSPHFQRLRNVLQKKRTRVLHRGIYHLDKQLYAWLHPAEMQRRADKRYEKRLLHDPLVLRDVYGLPTWQMARYQGLIFEEQEHRLMVEKEEIRAFRHDIWARRLELNMHTAFQWVNENERVAERRLTSYACRVKAPPLRLCRCFQLLAEHIWSAYYCLSCVYYCVLLSLHRFVDTSSTERDYTSMTTYSHAPPLSTAPLLSNVGELPAPFTITARHSASPVNVSPCLFSVALFESTQISYGMLLSLRLALIHLLVLNNNTANVQAPTATTLTTIRPVEPLSNTTPSTSIPLLVLSVSSLRAKRRNFSRSVVAGPTKRRAHEAAVRVTSRTTRSERTPPQGHLRQLAIQVRGTPVMLPYRTQYPVPPASEPREESWPREEKNRTQVSDRRYPPELGSLPHGARLSSATDSDSSCAPQHSGCTAKSHPGDGSEGITQPSSAATPFVPVCMGGAVPTAQEERNRMDAVWARPLPASLPADAAPELNGEDDAVPPPQYRPEKYAPPPPGQEQQHPVIRSPIKPAQPPPPPSHSSSMPPQHPDSSRSQPHSPEAAPYAYAGPEVAMAIRLNPTPQPEGPGGDIEARGPTETAPLAAPPSVTTGWTANPWRPMADPRTLWDALFCPLPPHQRPRFSAAIQRGPDVGLAVGLCCAMQCMPGTAALQGCAACLSGLPVLGLATCVVRQMIRTRFNIQATVGPLDQPGETVQNALTDLALSCFCMPCVMAQHHRELVYRGRFQGYRETSCPFDISLFLSIFLAYFNRIHPSSHPLADCCTCVPNTTQHNTKQNKTNKFAEEPRKRTRALFPYASGAEGWRKHPGSRLHAHLPREGWLFVYPYLGKYIYIYIYIWWPNKNTADAHSSLLLPSLSFPEQSSLPFALSSRIVLVLFPACGGLLTFLHFSGSMEHGPPPAEPANPYSHVSAPEEDDPFHGDAPHLSPQPEEDEDPLPPPQYQRRDSPVQHAPLYGAHRPRQWAIPPRMYENNAKLMDPEPSLGSGCCTAAPVPMPMPLSDDREPVDGTPIPSVAVGITLGYHTEANPNPAGPQNPSAVLPGQGQQPPQTEVQLESQGAPRGQWQESVWAFLRRYRHLLGCPSLSLRARQRRLRRAVSPASRADGRSTQLQLPNSICPVCRHVLQLLHAGERRCRLRHLLRVLAVHGPGGVSLAAEDEEEDKGYDCLEDFLTSCYCMPCVLAQQHRELVRRGDYKGSVVFSSSTSLAPVVPHPSSFASNAFHSIFYTIFSLLALDCFYIAWIRCFSLSGAYDEVILTSILAGEATEGGGPFPYGGSLKGMYCIVFIMKAHGCGLARYSLLTFSLPLPPNYFFFSPEDPCSTPLPHDSGCFTFPFTHRCADRLTATLLTIIMLPAGPEKPPHSNEEEDALPQPQYRMTSEYANEGSAPREEMESDPRPPEPPSFFENNEKLRDPPASEYSSVVKPGQGPSPYPVAYPLPQGAGVAMGITMGQPASGYQPEVVPEMPLPSPDLMPGPPPPSGWMASLWHPCADPGTFWDACICPCVLASGDYDALFHPHRVQNPERHNYNCPVAFGLLCLMCCVCVIPTVSINSPIISCSTACCCYPALSIVNVVLRQIVRSRYHIIGHTDLPPEPIGAARSCRDGCVDVLLAVFCQPCIMSQHHRELIHRGAYRGKLVFSNSAGVPAVDDGTRQMGGDRRGIGGKRTGPDTNVGFIPAHPSSPRLASPGVRNDGHIALHSVGPRVELGVSLLFCHCILSTRSSVAVLIMEKNGYQEAEEAQLHGDEKEGDVCTGIPIVALENPPDDRPAPSSFMTAASAEDWSSGLFDCCSDKLNLFDVCLCGVCNVSMQANVAFNNESGIHWPLCLCIVGVDGCLTGGLTLLLTGVIVRQKLRQRYMLQQTLPVIMQDIAAGLLCQPCAICQQHREMTRRGDWPGCVLFGTAPMSPPQTKTQEKVNEIVHHAHRFDSDLFFLVYVVKEVQQLFFKYISDIVFVAYAPVAIYIYIYIFMAYVSSGCSVAVPREVPCSAPLRLPQDREENGQAEEITTTTTTTKKNTLDNNPTPLSALTSTTGTYILNY